MTTIWKFPVEVTDAFSVKMPEGARILSVQVQGRRPVMWAVVDPGSPLHARRFRLYGTGHPTAIEQDRFIGTFQLEALVFHLFEVL